MLQPKTGSSFGYEISVAEFNIELSWRLGYRISCNECQIFVFHIGEILQNRFIRSTRAEDKTNPRCNNFFRDGNEMEAYCKRENSASIRTEKENRDIQIFV